MLLGLIAFFSGLLLLILMCIVLYCYKEYVKSKRLKERDELLLLAQKEEFMMQYKEEINEQRTTA